MEQLGPVGDLDGAVVISPGGDMEAEIAPRSVVEPGVRFGKPVIKGAQVPVELVVARAGRHNILVSQTCGVARRGRRGGRIGWLLGWAPSTSSGSRRSGTACAS